MHRRFLSFVFVGFLFQNGFAEVQLHVTPGGDDQSTGTAVEPLGSLQGARDRIRLLRAESESEVFEVLIHAGRYELDSSFVLNAEDSGSPQSPVTYRSVDGKVVVSGGRQIQDWLPLQDQDSAFGSRLHPSAKGNVVAIDVDSLDVTFDFNPRRLHEKMPPEHSELFIGNRRLPLAGWPNYGWARSSQVDARRWNDVRNSDQENAWAVGFWENDWTMSHEPIRKSGSNWMFTNPEGPKAMRDACRYKLCNMLTELDQPGEWFLDKEQSRILYWPIQGDFNSLTLSLLETVLSIYDTSNVRFDGICFESGRAMVVEVVRGSNIEFEHCQFTNAGNVAVHLYEGESHRLSRCEVSTTGSTAVRIEAGDRETLSPCNHIIESCDIHDFGQHYMTGRAGIALFGVGATVAHNRIYSAPDLAVGIYGNDFVIEHNEIFHVCKETDDCGAIYLGYDPTFRGNQIHHNYIHDLGGFSTTGVIGIYLDDYASGTLVESNYLRNCIRGIAVGGGRDNHIRGNVIHGGLAAIQMDARGSTWFGHHVQGQDSRIQTLCRNTLESFPIYAERYPTLATLLNDEPELPKGNRIESNEFNCRIGVDLQMPNKKIVEQNQNQRRTSSEAVDEILAKLGIQLEKKNVGDEMDFKYINSNAIQRD